MSIKINLLGKKAVKERVWKSLNIVVAVATVLNISGAAIWLQPSVAQAAPAANPSADLDQCANDQAPSPHTDGCATSATEWVNGNLGESKSVYLEGDSVPYRMRFENLTLGSHNVVIEWDTTKSGKHALDYITTYNRTVADANPCLGVTGCGASSIFPIPVDPQVSGGGVTQIAGNLTLFGGTITAVSPYTYPDGTGFTGDKSARITITFTASVATPVLAWGGHIAHRQDWGVENSAVAIPGSPYHTRLIDLDGSGGNQDRSLSAAAVIFPASITIIKQATPEGSQSFGYTSTGGLSPASFSLVDDGTSANTRAFSGITNFSTYTVSETALAGWALSFNSPVCTVTTTNGGSQSASSNTVTINLKEGENVTCTFNNDRQAATLTVIKHVINDNGGTAVASDFTLDAGGAGDSPDNFPGAEAPGTVITLDAGAYNVTESGPTGYAASYSADCSGTITYGQSKTCTVTNNDIQPKLTVTKVVINDNGGTKVIADFPLFVDATGVTSGVQNGFNAGTYTVSETNQAGYTSAISGDCSSNGSVTLAVGDVKSCTITNNDQASTLIVKKVLVNDNGGNAVVTDFSFKVNNGNTIVFEGDAQNDLVVDAGTYTVVETAATGYATTYDNCSNVVIPNGGTATCTITNNDIAPTITLNKVVINNNGGNAGVNDFGLTVGGSPVTSGQTVTVNANTPIALNEAGLAGYTFVSLTGDAKCPAVLNGTVSLNEGENITCTITNDDVAPTITLNKVVINDNGGNAGINDFGLTVGGNGVTSGQTVSVNSNTPIALNEAGLSGYTFVSITGDAKCPAILNGTVTLNEGENVTCTITNDDVAPSITLNKVVINDNGGTAGVNSFDLTIGGTPVNSGDTLNVMANTPVLLNEAGLFGYTFVSITGDAKCPAALNGAVTLDEGEQVTCTITNNDIAPQLTVYKIVINDDGGTAVSSDFTMNVAATNASPSQFPGSDLGTLVTLNQGAYSVTEAAFPGYTPAYSADCVGSINVGQSKVCVVTNTDNTPHLIVIKNVINDNGGTSVAGDFTMNVAGTDVSDPSFPGEETGTTVSLDTGAYAVTESGPSGYADNFSADCTGSITLGQTKICTVTNNDIAPRLTVIKDVVNDNGGNNVAGDFTMQVGGTNVSNPSFPGDESGTTVTLNQGAYTVGEIGLPGYVGTLSNDCVGTINVGEHKTCTITNNDVAPTITLNKVVITDNGGTAGVNDFGLTIGGTSVTSGQTLSVSANQAYALNEAGLFGYNFVSLTGDAKCPAVLNGSVTLDEGENVTCTITNNDIQPKLTITKVVVNDNGGNAVIADFDLFVDATQVVSGVQNGFNVGSYVVSEGTVNAPGYIGTISGDCDANGNVSLTVGQVKACTITNDDIAPTITLNKVVINDNGGNAGVNDFGLTIGGTAVTSGQTVVVNANTPIALNEAGLIGYSFVSLTGDAKCPAALNDTVTLDEGETVTCTITNDDVAPTITLNKIVTNDNGGNAGVNDFGLTIGGTGVTSGQTLAVNANTPIALNEAGLTGYTFVSLTGDAKCPAVLNGTVTLNEGENVTCTITNDDLAPSLTLVKHVTNTNGGTAVDTDWTLIANGPTSLSGTTPVTSAANFSAGTYTLSESGPSGYDASNWTCQGGTLNGNQVSVALDEDVTCEITNDDHLADVAIVKTPSAPTISAGGVVTYTMTWSITGQGFVRDAVIADTVPALTTYVPNSITCGTTVGTCTFDDTTSTLTWNIGDRVAGETGTVTFQATLNSPIVKGTTIDNTACISTPDDQNECDTTTITVDSDFTVGIVKTDNIDPVVAGGQVIYTLAWSVSGNAPLTSVILTDPIPANMTFVSATCGSTTGTCVISSPAVGATGTVAWNLGAHLPGDFGSVTVTMQSASPIANGTVVTNVATVCGQMTTAQQAVVEKCLPDEETTTITSTPSISITKSNNIVGFTNPGKTVTYTVVVTNAAAATDTAHAVNMTDLLPTGFTFVDGGLGTKTFALGDIAPGASVTTTYVVNISASQLAGIYTNTASAQGSNTGKVSATSNVEVRVPIILGSSTSPELTITKKVTPKSTTPGKIVSYTVVVKNIGDGDAKDVVVTDTLPAGFIFVDGGGTTKTWNLGTLEPNHERTLNYQVMVGENVKAGNYVNVAVATSDGQSVEARATVQVKIPKVLGLATTGVSLRDYVTFTLGLTLIALGAVWLNRQRRVDESAQA